MERTIYIKDDINHIYKLDAYINKITYNYLSENKAKYVTEIIFNNQFHDINAISMTQYNGSPLLIIENLPHWFTTYKK